MLITEDERFASSDSITLSFGGEAVSNAKQCVIKTFGNENFITPYGENEGSDTFLSQRKHYIILKEIQMLSDGDVWDMDGARLEIGISGKTLVFSQCRVFRTETQISGGKSVVTEIHIISPRREVLCDE